MNNTTTINSLTGTLGTAVGTAGSFSNFTDLATVNMAAGQTYDFSISSITTLTPYTNSLAIFIDWNRNGLFTDAGEMVYTPPKAPHKMVFLEDSVFIAISGLSRVQENYEADTKKLLDNFFV